MDLSSNVSKDLFSNVSKDLFSNVSKDLFSKVSEDLFSKGNVFLLQLQPAMHLPRSVGRRRRVQTSCFTTKRIDQLPLALSEAKQVLRLIFKSKWVGQTALFEAP